MTDKNTYVISPDLQAAVWASEVTQRPLLIKGEPGTGKTRLAYHLANERNIPLYTWHIKSTTTATDGLYFYDAVTRLNDSRFQSASCPRNVENINDYIRLGPLGMAFTANTPSILLIDEVDKADIEFPNDLLLELDEMKFTIAETGEEIKAIQRPLVIITSNSEKDLPEAFLRRCLFHYIDFPDTEMMRDIVKSHYPDIQEGLLQESLQLFYELREMDQLKKKPSTSELIDWIQVLYASDLSQEENKKKGFIQTLLKDEMDQRFFKRRS